MGCRPATLAQRAMALPVLSTVRTLTIEHEKNMIPSAIAFVCAAGGVRWDLMSLFSWCRSNGDDYDMKNWQRKVRKLVGGPDSWSGDEVKFRSPDTPADSIEPVISTRCMVLLLSPQLALNNLLGCFFDYT